MELNLYPPPRKTRTYRQALDIAPRTFIRVRGDVDDRLMRALRRFAGRRSDALQITHGTPAPERILLTVDCRRGGHDDHDAYTLVCNGEGLTLTSKTAAGIHCGLMTLDQILDECGARIPFLTIEDHADFDNRGVMLDISRCKVPTLATLRTLIDDLARLKFNQLQLYTEHTFAFVNHPLVWSEASPLTANDILALQDWCDDRYIELVPNLNSFGHFERWLRYPEYHKYAECPNGFLHPLSGERIAFGSTLKPNRTSLALLKELYDEMLPLFSSTQFNIGGDEPWELGLGWSKAQCEKKGTTRVYLEFLGEIRKLVERRGRSMMFWSDIVLREPESIAHLSRRVTAMNWGYEANHPFKKECEQMAAARVPFYVCPGTSSWNSLTGRIANAEANLASAARHGLATDAAGYLITDWGDHGHHQYLPISYPGFLIGASHAWNHRASRKLDWKDGLNRLFFDDPSGATGDLLWSLGKMPELAPSKIRNATVFNRLLFWGMRHEPTATASIPDEQLDDCLSAFEALRRRLPAIGARREPQLVRAELENAIDLASHAVQRLRYFRDRRTDLTRLRASLSEAIGRHERLWLARNRPGGLRESVGHLHRSLDALSGNLGSE